MSLFFLHSYFVLLISPVERIQVERIEVHEAPCLFPFSIQSDVTSYMKAEHASEKKLLFHYYQIIVQMDIYINKTYFTRKKDLLQDILSNSCYTEAPKLPQENPTFLL